MAHSGEDGAGSARQPMLTAPVPTSGPADGPSPSSTPVGVWVLFRYATPSDKLLLLLGIVGAAVQGLSGPALSFFMKDLFQAVYLPNDDGSLPPHATGSHRERDDEVMRNLIIFASLAAVAFLSSGVSFLAFSYVGDRLALGLKHRFFDQLLKKDVGWYDLHSSAEMSTRLTNDTYDFRQGVGEKLAQLIMGLTMSPAGFVVAFIHDWRLTLIMLIAMPFMVAGFATAMKVLASSASAQQELYAKAGGLAETAIGAIRTVAAFGGFEREAAKYDEQLEAAERSGIRAGWSNGMSIGFSQLAIYGTFALGFWAGSILIVDDYRRDCWVSSPPFGTCFTGSTMLSTLFAVLYGGIGLGQSAPGLSALTAAKAAAARIYAVIDEPPAFDADVGAAPEGGVEGRVELRGVVFSYPSRPDAAALRGVSFAVAAGETVALVGPSGSGKSTAIALLQRFYDPKEGQVLVDGVDIRSLSPTWLRAHMALVQQEPVLFSGTIFDNIAYGAAGHTATQQTVEAAATAANAHAFILSFPSLYSTEVGERGAQLSGGQKQRIAIARAIIRDPAILLLDEATSALDSESERIVQKALDELLAQKARTTIVVAHRLSTIRDADRILVFEAGRLVQSGTHEELAAEGEGSLYAQLVKSQEAAAAAPNAAPAPERRLSRELSSTPSSPHSPLRRRLSGGDSPAPRSLSRTFSAGIAELLPPSGSDAGHPDARDGSGDAAPVAGAPGEDDADVSVPPSRLWAMQKPDFAYMLFALLCTIPVGCGRPFMGFLFSHTSDLFSQPVAIKLPDGTWHGVLDTEDLREQANKQCFEFLLLGCVMCVATCGQLGGFRRSAESLTRRVRSETFRAMLRQETGWFDARTTGHLADRLASEAPLIKAFTGESFASVIQLLFCLGSGLGIAIWASWLLTVCSLVFLPMLAMGTAAMIKAMRRINDTSAGPLVSEVMGHVKTVAAFGLRQRMLDRYLEILKLEGKQDRKRSVATSFASAYNSAVSFLMFGGVIFIANLFINRGWIEPKDVLQVLFPVMFSASGAAVASQWQADKAKARLALNHIFSTLDRAPLIDAYDTRGQRLESVRGDVEFRHVALRYPTRPDVMVFQDFNLRIDAGQTVAFCGPSGSGKSSAIALLQRFYDPTSGSVHLDGTDLRELNLGWLRKQMALVQQEPVLFAGTILDNIAYGKEDASEDECLQAAKKANAHDFIVNFPGGYRTDVGERGGQLSGGQKQRVAIARSIVRDPAILLLDEATSALDPESERVVQEALDELLRKSRRTTLVIAHRLSTIERADVICVIAGGAIVERGTHHELMRLRDGHYLRLASRQQAS